MKKILFSLGGGLALFAFALAMPAMAAEVNPDSSIQEAINVASDGDVIQVNEGTYNESLTIDGVDIKLVANGEVILRPTSVCPDHGDVIQIRNSKTTVEGFTIDANGCLGGIYARGMAEFNEESAYLIAKNNLVYNYGKNGITVNGEKATAVVEGNTVKGRGILEVGDYAQNGIQFGWMASGEIKDNTVYNHYYNGCSGNGISTCTWVATGVLLYLVDPMEMKPGKIQSDNNLYDNQYDILNVNAPSLNGGGYQKP